MLGCHPSQSGYVAGASGATFELTCYTIGAMRAVAHALPRVRLSLHVDDLAHGVAEPTLDGAVQALAASAAHLQHEFRELHLPFSLRKWLLVGSSQEATRRGGLVP